jgi:urease gamma subunit
MKARRIAVVAAAGALVAGGAGAAIGATQKDKGKETEAAILADAAKTLQTTPEKLRDALGSAEDSQLDQAVKDGDLTQAQADEIKKHRQESGSVLGIPPRGPVPFGPGREIRFGPGAGGALADAAKALGLTPQQLMSRLRDGKTVAGIAKAQGKDLAAVKAAVKAGEKQRLDEAVKAGKLTQKQADEILSHADDVLDRLADKPLGMRGGMRGGPGFRFHVEGRGPIADVAKAVGLTEAQVLSRLRDGKTIAEIAKAQGKDLADVRAAVKAAEKQRLDAAVKAGKLTQKQADEIVSHADDFVDHLGDRPFGRFRHGPPPGAPPIPVPPPGP